MYTYAAKAQAEETANHTTGNMAGVRPPTSSKSQLRSIEACTVMARVNEIANPHSQVTPPVKGLERVQVNRPEELGG